MMTVTEIISCTGIYYVQFYMDIFWAVFRQFLLGHNIKTVTYWHPYHKGDLEQVYPCYGKQSERLYDNDNDSR